MSPSETLRALQEKIAAAAQRSGRRSEDITLLAVTKTVPTERIQPFLEAGIREVGESRVQEAEQKWGGGGVEAKIHLIGPLQSNKAKKAVALFDMIQTLDRWDLAQDIERHAAAAGKIQDCLIQIKISDEPTKSGLDPAALPDLLSRLTPLSHVRIRGLMGIPPFSATGPAARPYFQKLYKLFEQSRPHVPNVPTVFTILSMGMSSDFEAAIEEGSTLVRIGSALFGARN